MGLYLGIDIGGTVTKAGVYDESGNELYIAEQNSDVIKLQPGFTERNMDELWQTTTALIRQCVAARGNDISGISFSSHGKGLYAVNKHGLPVRNGIISSDTRCESMVKSWEESGLLNKTYDRGLQQLWTGHPVALLAWLKEYERDNYDAIDSILMVHDYVRFMMTGELSAEITNISGSNLYNPIKGDYDPSLMADFNLAECEDKTAPIINSAQLSGKVTAQCAELTGLKVGTPVFGGLFDVVAAGITSCISDPSVISAVAGTWTITTMVCDEISRDNYPYIWGNYCIPGKYFVHEGSPTSASNLAWFKSQCFDAMSWEEINAAFTTASRQESLYFLPYLYGSNFSTGMPGGLIGLRGHHTKNDIIRAVYEGIVFSHLRHQDRIISLNPQVEKIRFTGGPTHSLPWMQLFADASGLPLEIIDIQQSGCRAAALCAAVGAGEYHDFAEAMQATMPPVINVEPNMRTFDEVRSRYAKFTEINQKISELY